MALTQQDIEDGLRNLGIQENDHLEVHSSLSSFGHVRGGASTIIHALMTIVGKNGVLIMSNYPLSRPLPLSANEKEEGIGWKLQILPENSSERTVTGMISDEFRKQDSVVCGTGIHRICAWGRDAEQHIEGYQLLLERDGRVLLLGVDIDRCSSLHLAENEQITKAAKEKMRKAWPKSESKIPDKIKQKYPPSIVIGPKEEGPGIWQNACDEAKRRNLIKMGKIGRAECLLFNAREMVSLVKEIRRKGPFSC